MCAERIAVAHLVRRYLPTTATFIYQYITNMHRYEPVVLAALKEHPGRFPFPGLHIPDLSEMQTFFVKVDRRLFHRERLVEPFFRQVIRSSEARLLHAHFGPMGVLALPLRSAELPMVTTFYGKDMSVFPRRPGWLKSYRSLFQEGDLFLVEGSHMKEKLAELGCPLRKIQIQRIGVDLRSFAYRPAPPIDDNVRILMCGRFVEKKGFEYGIRAFSRVVNEFPDVQLRIVGDGPLRPGVERLIRDLDVDDRVVLLGYLDYDSYAREAEKAHLFMAPSVTAASGDSEGGAPTVILEMEARGLPVLSTRHADIPEVVIDEVSGYLVPERDEIALATKLSRLLAHPETWNEMGKAGRSHIENQHDVVKLAQQLEEKYDGVRLAAE